MADVVITKMSDREFAAIKHKQAIRNLRTIARSFEIDLPDDDLTRMLPTFDEYARLGADFGTAFLKSLEVIHEDIVLPDKGE